MDSRKAVAVLAEACAKDAALAGPVYVQVALGAPAVDERPQHPLLLPLPHRFRRRDETLVCLVVKDPSAATAAALAQDAATAGLFDEVIGVGKLRRRVAGGRATGRTTKAAERFAKSFQVVFVHEKVREPLAEVLGLGFHKRARHLPVPVSFNADSADSRRRLRATVRAAMQSAQLILRPESRSTSVRVGHTQMSPAKLAANIDAAVRLCRERLPRGLGGSAVYYIKTPDSLALQLAVD